MVRAAGTARVLVTFAAAGAGVSAEASVAAFRRTARVVGSVFELSVFRVVFAMSSVVPFLKRAATPAPARGIVQRRTVE